MIIAICKSYTRRIRCHGQWMKNKNKKHTRYTRESSTEVTHHLTSITIEWAPPVLLIFFFFYFFYCSALIRQIIFLIVYNFLKAITTTILLLLGGKINYFSNSTTVVPGKYYPIWKIWSNVIMYYQMVYFLNVIIRTHTDSLVPETWYASRDHTISTDFEEYQKMVKSIQVL